MYELKKGMESFTVVDGPFAGRTYVPGRAYAEIPPQDKGKFETVPEDPEPVIVAPEAKAAKTEKTKAAVIDAAPEKEKVEVQHA